MEKDYNSVSMVCLVQSVPSSFNKVLNTGLAEQTVAAAYAMEMV